MAVKTEQLDQWHSEGQYMAFNADDGEYSIFYRDTAEDNKPVLLLIHGFPTCSWDWAKIWSQLNKHFRLVTLDMLGFGFSDKPDRAYSIFEQADIFEQLLIQLDINQYHILAHDYGDTVAQELLARNSSGKLLSVVFSNGGLFPETHHPVLVQKLLLSPLGAIISKLMSYKKFKANFDKICAKNLSDAELQSYWQMVLHKQGNRIFHRLITYMLERRKHRERWVAPMVNAQVPLHLVDGILDPISGGHMVQRYRELIPNPDVTELKDTGHYPQVESPQAFLEGCLGFWIAKSII